MQILHKIVLNESKKEAVAAFRLVGASSKKVGDIWVFKVVETDPHWAALKKILDKFHFTSQISTIFTNKELEAARYLRMHPSWHHGYPQPDEDDQYLSVTYDPLSFCHTCYTRQKQIAPFRMKSEPVWGSRSILQLNWVFGEFFVKPDVWEKVFRPYGIASRPVLHQKTGKVLDTVLQLVIDENVELNIADLEFSQCPDCGVRKYLPFDRGWFPSPLRVPSSHIFRSYDYFGSGGVAYQPVLISHELYMEIKNKKVKGAEFSACKPALIS